MDLFLVGCKELVTIDFLFLCASFYLTHTHSISHCRSVHRQLESFIVAMETAPVIPHLVLYSERHFSRWGSCGDQIRRWVCNNHKIRPHRGTLAICTFHVKLLSVKSLLTGLCSVSDTAYIHNIIWPRMLYRLIKRKKLLVM